MKNKEINSLSKLASIVFNHLSKKVFVEKLPRRSIKDPIIETLEITEEGESWMTPYILFLKKKEYYLHTKKKPGRSGSMQHAILCMKTDCVRRGIPFLG